MDQDKLARLDPDEFRNLHRNCLLKLDDPARVSEATRLLTLVHAEFTRRAIEEQQDDFLPMLACVGYNVRWHGLGLNQRRRLLDWLIEGELPSINDPEFMNSWGLPGSRQRLEMLIETIEAYRRRWGNGPGMENAAARWDADFAYLRSLQIKRG